MNFTSVLLTSIFFINVLFSIEVRLINPPKLGEGHIGKKILCYRPMRHLFPNLSLECIDNKVVIHNYGHGGSGWSIGPGSVEYCFSLFDEKTPKLDREIPIAVIGGGCIGLFTAYHLLEEGFTNITLYAMSFENLTSHHAGGLLSMRTLGKSVEEQAVSLELGCVSTQFYRKIAEGNHKNFQGGASMIPTYFVNREQSELEVFVNKVMQPAKDVLVDFGSGVTRKMIVYDDSLFIDTGSMMKQLTALLKDKILFKQREIHEFTELDEPIIFNCSGFGSQKLHCDDSLYSVQGHLILLENQSPEELNYMMVVDWEEDLTKNRQRVLRTLDFFPKKCPGAPFEDLGVLGGTFIECAETTTPNEEEFPLILQRAKDFFFNQSALSSF